MKPIVLILVMGMVSLGLPAPTWADGMVPLRQGPVEPQVSEGEDAAEADLSQRILVQETLARQASVAFVTTTRGGTIPPPINPPIDPSDLNLPLPEGDPIPEDFDIEQEIIKAVIDYWMNRGIDVEELPITPMPLLPDHPPGPHHIGPDPSTEEAPPPPPPLDPPPGPVDENGNPVKPNPPDPDGPPPPPPPFEDDGPPPPPPPFEDEDPAPSALEV